MNGHRIYFLNGDGGAFYACREPGGAVVVGFEPGGPETRVPPEVWDAIMATPSAVLGRVMVLLNAVGSGPRAEDARVTLSFLDCLPGGTTNAPGT